MSDARLVHTPVTTTCNIIHENSPTQRNNAVNREALVAFVYYGEEIKREILCAKCKIQVSPVIKAQSAQWFKEKYRSPKKKRGKHSFFLIGNAIFANV